MHQLQLFPGWAVRKYRRGNESTADAEFDVEVFVSGYASSLRSAQYATRSQKVFMQLAKRFAALPKLPSSNQPDHFTSNNPLPRPALSRSTEDLLKSHPLPATPSEMTEEREFAALDAQFRKAEEDIEDDTVSIESTEDIPPPSPSTAPSWNTSSRPSISELRIQHANLDSRLQAFWSSAIAEAPVKITISSSQTPPDAKRVPHLIDITSPHDEPTEPFVSRQLTTTPQGAFQQKFRITWEQLIENPAGHALAYGERNPDQENTIYVHAELLPSPSHPHVTSPSPRGSSSTQNPKVTMPVQLSHAKVRVISDIDDTVKVCNILGGTKAVFHNVFVHPLEHLVVRAMSEWYYQLWQRGVRFHYVSNSPYELLPVITDFFRISKLPQGSLKLKSYTGRSLFNGILSSPSVRKRANLVEVLDSFPECHFFLIGDSGEQDLELYATIAKERPNQILAVFIRDVTTAHNDRLEDPTGANAGVGWENAMLADSSPLLSEDPDEDDLESFKTAASSRSSLHRITPDASLTASPAASPAPLSPPLPPRKPNSRGELPPPVPPRRQSSIVPSPASSSQSSISTQRQNNTPTLPERERPVRKPSVPGSYSSQWSQSNVNVNLKDMTPSEKRKYELQQRIFRARMEMPPHVKLRIFREPAECYEAAETLRELGY
ncbi:hypothetical protein SISSUDRAFT_1022458 [Sistotremastrum suecicum HHB10207 ss-3]|uniref:Phosphatidate phosphatase APP1 catalytic domain-containing protein n=1 Tax=Sistotremastrum suecicum HHB10207 ss-3 TaxID=1314776 RepID=A0A166CRX3_9AGAM|nr:hypothetical protein SISSUDRAFT_1022458 [Sistotremastrum suecicum HHB10207 ss-3]